MIIPDINTIVSDILASTLAGNSFKESLERYLYKIMDHVRTQSVKEYIKNKEDTSKYEYDKGYKLGFSDGVNAANDYKKGYDAGFKEATKQAEERDRWRNIEPNFK